MLTLFFTVAVLAVPYFGMGGLPVKIGACCDKLDLSFFPGGEVCRGCWPELFSV